MTKQLQYGDDRRMTKHKMILKQATNDRKVTNDRHLLTAIYGGTEETQNATKIFATLNYI